MQWPLKQLQAKLVLYGGGHQIGRTISAYKLTTQSARNIVMPLESIYLHFFGVLAFNAPQEAEAQPGGRHQTRAWELGGADWSHGLCFFLT